MVEGIFASCLKKERKKIPVMDDRQPLIIITVTTGAQPNLARLVQFMAAFCEIITGFVTCTSTFCIKHLFESSSFVFCSAEFSDFQCALIEPPEKSQRRVNSFTERSFKASSSSSLPSFSSAIRFHYLPDNYTLLHSHISSVKDLNFPEDL